MAHPSGHRHAASAALLAAREALYAAWLTGDAAAIREARARLDAARAASRAAARRSLEADKAGS